MNWNKINECRRRSEEKYKFYFGNYDYQDFCESPIAKKIPKSFLGWGKRAVEMRANKTHFDCFENDALGLTKLFEKYHVYEAFNKIKEDTLVAGCGFLALADDNRVLPFTAEEATGTFNWKDQILSFGVAAFTSETTRNAGGIAIPNSYKIYEKDVTITKREGEDEIRTPNPTGRPLMGLLTYHSTTKRPFGNSVLTPAARGAIVDGSRTLRQAMISAYYYNSKIDVILGADNTTAVDKVPMKTGDVLKVGTNENGQIPQLGELAQHTMTPFTDTMNIAARNFCADTKLSLANLGISTAAPQSPEALEIVGDDLRDDINEWHRELGQQLKSFAVTLYMKENNIKRIDQNLQELINATVPVWLPVYKADFAKFGDGLIKIAQYAPSALKARSVWRTLGLTSQEIDEVVASLDAQTLGQ